MDLTIGKWCDTIVILNRNARCSKRMILKDNANIIQSKANIDIEL